MADDEGVLGKLPNSRPGTRSEKRASADRPGKTASKAAAKAEAGGKPAAKAAPGSKPRARAKPAATAKPGRAAAGAGAPPQRTAAGARAKAGARAAAERRQPADPPRPQPSGDAVTSVVRGAATVAATGVRVAGAVTQEILRRLPRP
jgi:hypothetical protein